MNGPAQQAIALRFLSATVDSHDIDLNALDSLRESVTHSDTAFIGIDG